MGRVKGWQSKSGYKYGTAITTTKINSNYYDPYQHYRDADIKCFMLCYPGIIFYE